MADEADDKTQELIGDGTPAIDDSPESGIESLRQQIAEANQRADREQQGRQAEQQAREEAERRMMAAGEEARTSRRSAADAEYDSVINALSAAKGELDGVKAAYRIAMSEGDFDKAADLAGDIGLVAARLREFESGKTALDHRRQAGDQQQQQPSGDPRESYIRSMPPRTAAWLRRNDRFFTDGNMQRMVQGAHALALGKGIAPESDEYFAFIEEQSGLRQAQPTQQQTPTTAAAATTARQSAPAMAAAPPAGSTAQSSRQPAGNTITLSAEERDLCRTTGITEAAYAKQKAALISEGLINAPTRH